jgi:hypothetical protein
MWLEDVLQNDGDVPCSVVEHLLKTLPAFVGDEGRQELKHGLVTFRIML